MKKEEQLREKEKQVEELETRNSDLLSSLTAKRSLIDDLQDQLKAKRACTLSGGNKLIYSCAIDTWFHSQISLPYPCSL